MAVAMPDGAVCFTPQQTPDVLRQLRAAGLKVSKAKPVSADSISDADLLAALT